MSAENIGGHSPPEYRLELLVDGLGCSRDRRHDALHAETASERTRANEALMSRVFGKPKETVETVEKPLALQAVEDMTPEELSELWRQI